ncbi:MAG: hypothetical protein R3A52_31225 [Polyangiales bacterium]
MRRAWVVVAVALAGCGHTSVHRWVIGPVGAPSRVPARVFSARGATPPAAEVALVEAVGTGTHADGDQAIEALRREAQSMGCDAVLRVEVAQGANTTVATGVAARLGQRADLLARVAEPPPMAALTGTTATGESSVPPPWSVQGAANATDAGVSDAGASDASVAPSANPAAPWGEAPR